MFAAVILGLVVLVPIHGAFWLGIRNERMKVRLMFNLAMRRRL